MFKFKIIKLGGKFSAHAHLQHPSKPSQAYVDVLCSSFWLRVIYHTFYVKNLIPNIPSTFQFNRLARITSYNLQFNSKCNNLLVYSATTMSGPTKVSRPNLDLQERVFTGNFPKEAVSKMNRQRLERFVLQLVESTSGVSADEAQDFEGLCRRLFLKEVDKPQWWPSDQIISRTITPDGRYLMDLLKFLVYKCCEFFKKPKENLNTEVFVTQVDENLRRSKRKLCDLHSAKTCVSEVTSVKRRTLLPRNYSTRVNKSSEILSHIKNPVINLQDILYKPNKSLDQGQFLKLFQLKSISSPITEKHSALPLTSYSSVKFNMCAHIPFSSDLGMELMRHDNHTCPEITKSRKLDRLEWHLNNKPSTNTDTDISFPVSYQEKKNTTFHTYKFPKRQHYQRPGQLYNGEIEDWHQRYLTVSVVCDDLQQLHKTYQRKSKSKLQVVLSRINEKGKSRRKPLKQKQNKGKVNYHWYRRKKSKNSTKKVH